ncbi:CRISPR system precrRNA processing endoribonuclease RAMP protein Cas6 [Streptomyces sp. AC558_RSS880]|uniref:CRISPR system precrRNA processing endoribonuclease RAMP protein Cas6 n=1 Tax=Streptomyces sp. AC558_RSS880 TaxID=2823687 RepID=UPI001C2265FA|nr:CRISPR system precrRNA processing endoribonuclease RAMP protein Cas6 [Streptomyces sp. AC558_RSS880]
MPQRWHLLLRPDQATRRKHVLPAHLHGLACQLLEGAGADHHGQVKPFSVTPLVEAPDAPGCAAFTLGWLDDRTMPPLEKLVGEQVRLGSQHFTVEDVRGEGAPYAALLSLPTSHRAAVDFLSVTYFSRSGRWIPLPDPELVYRSLARRWNAFATGHPVSDETLTDLLASVALSAHDIASAAVELGQGHRIGFRGHATFTLPRRPNTPAASSVFTALSHFAELAGVGAQTTHGLGWTRVDVSSPERSAHR